MSYLATVINKYYFDDIVEVSDGFFLSVCDEIDLHQITNLCKLTPKSKFDLCEKFNILREPNGKYCYNVRKLDEVFLKYKKYNQYKIKNELADYISTPKIQNIIQIYGNDKIINCDLEMEVAINTKSMLSNLFYKVLVPYEQMNLSRYLDVDCTKADGIYGKAVYDKTITYYIQVSFAVDEICKDFKIIDVIRHKPEPRIPKDGIELTSSLVPNIKLKDIPYFVSMLCEKYDISTPIDIEEVVKKMGLTVIDAYRLKRNANGMVKGLVCLSNGVVEVEEGIVKVKEGTILIDKNLKRQSLGSYKFIILHECVHYELHKYFLTLRRQIADINFSISRGNVDYNSEVENDIEIEMKKAIIDDIVNDDNIFSNENRVEWQANTIAARLLVPTEKLINKLFEKYDEYNYWHADDKELILRKIIIDLAKYFGSSREVMKIRIRDLANLSGIFISENDLMKLAFENNFVKAFINYNRYMEEKFTIDDSTLFCVRKFRRLYKAS